MESRYYRKNEQDDFLCLSILYLIFYDVNDCLINYKSLKMSYGNVPPPESISKFGRRWGDEQARLANSEKEKQYNELVKGGKSAKGGEDVDDDYFDRDLGEEEEEDFVEESGQRRSNGKSHDDDDEDELDSFMSEINKQAKQEVADSKKKEEHLAETGDYTGGQEGRDDIEKEDMHESLIKFMEEYKERQDEEEDEVYEYDEDGNVIWTWKKEIDPLPPVNHSEMQYKPFKKNLYQEHPDIMNLTPQQTFELRIALDIRIYGRDPPKPVVSFAHFNFDKAIMAQIRRSEFEKPTPVQAQAVPAALSGRDVLGLAQTGSGKTLAYIWPSIVHIMSQSEISPGEGPIALIVVPTRELALQVYNEARKYAAPYNIAVVCAYGGGSKYEQQKALEQGAELVIATPGRIIDLVKIEATNFLRTTFLVLDEVDRMFDLGFEPQVKSIADHIRPDRQCLVFSATCKAKIEKLIVNTLYDPVKILCGDVGEANADVQQTVLVVTDQQAKFNWLLSNIVKFITMGKLLIFVTKKIDADDVSKKLKLREIEHVLLHGDMHQQERNEKITAFRTTKPVMVATDVAARGLDIAEIQNVVNFDVARDIDTHVHRIGRTGRAGHRGFAYTLVTEKDSDFSAHLVNNLESSDQSQAITNELLAVATKCQWFKDEYEKQKQGATPGTTLGGMSSGGRTTTAIFKPKERPGFGLTKSMPSTSAATHFGQASAALSQQPSISKQIERAKSLASTGNVAGMNLMEMMRSALKNNYKSTFQRSSGNDFASNVPASDPRPEWKVRLDQQAEKINQAIKSGADPGKEEAATTTTEVPKKRSRWGT